MNRDGFWSDERGAISIDWVALTAGLVILSAAIGGVVKNEVQALMSNSELYMLQSDKFQLPTGSS